MCDDGVGKGRVDAWRWVGGCREGKREVGMEWGEGGRNKEKIEREIERYGKSVDRREIVG